MILINDIEMRSMYFTQVTENSLDNLIAGVASFSGIPATPQPPTKKMCIKHGGQESHCTTTLLLLPTNKN